jgi:hypothetical protein
VAQAFYNLGYLQLSDGEDSSAAYLSFAQDDTAGTATISVPLNYYPPEGEGATDALLELGLDATTGSIVSETYYAYDPNTGAYGELSPDPAGLIVPLVQNYLPATDEYVWVETLDGTGLYAELENLQYDIVPLPSGTRLIVELWVVDFGGNAAYVSSVVTVP